MRALFLAAIVVLVAVAVLLLSLRAEPTVQTATLFAASSTREAVEAAVTKSPVPVRTSFAGTNTIATQVLNGAAADVLISADTVWVEELVTAGIVEESSVFLSNDLVIVVGHTSPEELSPESLVTMERIALAGEGVPAGRYARQALDHYGLTERLRDRTINALDVRAALALVEQGDADAAIVYATDAAVASNVHIVHTFAPSSHDPIEYVAVRLNGSERAKALYRFLLTGPSIDEFVSRGFKRSE